MISYSRVRRTVVTVALSVLATTLAAVWAQEAPTTPWVAPARAARKANPVAVDDASIAAGKPIFEKNCLSCHGATGKGNGPAAKDLKVTPGDLSNPKLWEQTDGALFRKLTEGRTPMPTFDKLLTETDRWQVINYVRTLSPKPAATQP